MVQENEIDTALLESELDDVKRAARRLADALQDIFNEVGEIPEVSRIFSSVAEDLAEHKGLVHNTTLKVEAEVQTLPAIAASLRIEDDEREIEKMRALLNTV